MFAVCPVSDYGSTTANSMTNAAAAAAGDVGRFRAAKINAARNRERAARVSRERLSFVLPRKKSAQFFLIRCIVTTARRLQRNLRLSDRLRTVGFMTSDERILSHARFSIVHRNKMLLYY